MKGPEEKSSSSSRGTIFFLAVGAVSALAFYLVPLYEEREEERERVRAAELQQAKEERAERVVSERLERKRELQEQVALEQRATEERAERVVSERLESKEEPFAPPADPRPFYRKPDPILYEKGPGPISFGEFYDLYYEAGASLEALVALADRFEGRQVVWWAHYHTSRDYSGDSNSVGLELYPHPGSMRPLERDKRGLLPPDFLFSCIVPRTKSRWHFADTRVEPGTGALFSIKEPHRLVRVSGFLRIGVKTERGRLSGAYPHIEDCEYLAEDTLANLPDSVRLALTRPGQEREKKKLEPIDPKGHNPLENMFGR